MGSVSLLQSVLGRIVIKLIDEGSIRNMLLYQKEELLHESPDPDEFNVPKRFLEMTDDERRGFIRGLRWVISEDDLR